MENDHLIILNSVLNFYRKNRNSKAVIPVEKEICKIIDDFDVGQIEIIIRVLGSIVSAYRGTVLSFARKGEIIKEVLLDNLAKTTEILKREDRENPDDFWKNGAALSAIMNLIDGESRLIHGKTYIKNPTNILKGGGWSTLRCHSPEELLSYYEQKRTGLLYRITFCNVVLNIPIEQSQRYETQLRRWFPLVKKELLQRDFTRWKHETGIETSPTGLIIDSKLWANFTSVAERLLEEEIDEENKIFVKKT